MNFMRILILSFLVFITAGNIWSNAKLAEAYIGQFKQVAVGEMRRSGVPASIKLAQGLLESDWGRSEMASKANNHFGIKCGGDWTGDVFYKYDDDYDLDGNLKQSCFRSYVSAEQSYIAHSEFLSNPAKKARYGFLFNFPTTDYISWANGLKFAGYATDPKYPDKLIKIIETYKLHQYDELVEVPKYMADISTHKPEVEIKVKDDLNKDREINIQKDKYKQNSETASASTNNRKTRPAIKKINNIKYVAARDGETIEEIASSLKVDKHDIFIYNEGKYFLDSKLAEGDVIFLEKKKRFNEVVEYHLVKEKESLFTVAQKYGIRISNLASRNRIPEHAFVLPGTKLYINKNAPSQENKRVDLANGNERGFIDFGNLK